MKTEDMLHYSVQSLRHRRLRSFLTVLGIVVGISSIVLLIGLVQGLKVDILKQLESFGPRTLIVIPTNVEAASGPTTSFSPTTGKLFETDYERIKRFPDIQSISRVIISSTTMQSKDQEINAQVYGIEADTFRDTSTLNLQSGRFLTPNDRGVAVLGAKVADGFKQNITSGSQITLGGRPYKVIGVLQPLGSNSGGIDNVVFIQFKEAKDIFNASLLDNEISAIRIVLKEGSNVSADAQAVTDIMLNSHRVTPDKKDFGIISAEFINKQFSSVLDILTLFLGAIASISLIVGGIGISNTIFMSVLERRREIGTMEAVGGTEATIRNIFLLESCIIGFAGGLAGVIVAVVIGLLIGFIGNITFLIDPAVLGGALAFSVIIGAVSGTFPARNAAKVDPIVALRYE